jgi:ribosomal protein L11 methyltransferase
MIMKGPPRPPRPPRDLWRLRVAVTEESEDAVTCLMDSVFGRPVSVYTDVRRGRTWATVYLARLPDWIARRKALVGGLRDIKALGLDLPRVHAALARVPAEDWAESWKRHFKPLAIGRQLLILPSWSRRRPTKNQATLILDPGLSFGTGQHPTTRFCLEEIVSAREEIVREELSLLDIGCGSGILAIAAIRLGYSPVQAFDFDPQAVQVADANARKNGVRPQLHLSPQDLTRLPLRPARVFGVVCANLTSDLLAAKARLIAARVAPGGKLVLAGILATQFSAVRRAYARLGFRLRRSTEKGEWRSGSFRRA